jgi:8-oxo-dGTP pyrophosphatase MutT (NUDIX family)
MLGCKSMIKRLFNRVKLSTNKVGLMIRIISRVITFDPVSRRVLLVRNRNADFWYAPGGGWQAGSEDIRACAERELLEETGIAGKICRLIYTQQFQDNPETIFLEWFWLAHPAGATEIPGQHHDDHGAVCEARWFTQDELQVLKVFPLRLKNTFWNHVDSWPEQEDPFLGVS